MTLTFGDTHNMVAYLNKSDASEGFTQIINFLNGSYIEYALTVNPTIYVSCIKQFWNIVAVKQSNDVTRLQALVDKKKVVVTEAATETHYAWMMLKESIACPMKRFLLNWLAWSMSAKSTSWNEFSSAMASDVICLSIGDLSTHTTKYISPVLTQNVFTNVRKVGKGCFGVETPLFEGMLVAREPEEKGDVEEQGTDDNAAEEPDTAASEYDVAQDLEIIKLKKMVKKLERANKVKALKLRRLRKVGTSQRADTSDDTIMEDVKDITGDAQAEGRQAEIYQIDMDHAVKVLSMQDDEPQVQEVVEVVTIAKLVTKVVAAVSEAVSAARPNIAAAVVPAATITAAPVKAKFNANMEFLLKSKEQIEEEANRALKSINKTPAQKAAKRRRINEEVKDVEGIK
nr:hypothetical protein [Tanacetum cinerariifolium]